MDETAAQRSRSVRPKSRIGRPFKPGNAGKPRGTRDRYTLVGIEVARAIAGRAADRLAALVDSRSPRIAFEASRLVLAYAWGAPRQTLELSGGFGDLGKELAAALVEARARRVALDAGQAVAGLLDAAEAIPAAPAADVTVLDAEVVKEPRCTALSTPGNAEIEADLLSTVEAANVEGTIQHSTTPEKGVNNTSDK